MKLKIIKQTIFNWITDKYLILLFPRYLKDKLKNSIFLIIFIFIFLFIFQPFGLYRVKEHLLFLCFFYAITSGSIFFVNQIILIKLVFRKKQTGLRFIIWAWYNLLLIIIGNVFVHSLFFNSKINFSIIYNFIFWTLTVGIIPSVFMVLLYKKNNKYRNIREPIVKIPSAGGYMVNISINKLILAASLENYIRLFTLNKNNEVNETLYRIPLISIEKKLLPWKYFIRCHKQFLINLNFVNSIVGTAPNYKVRIEGINFDIPISRMLSKFLISKLITSGVPRI